MYKCLKLKKENMSSENSGMLHDSVLFLLIISRQKDYKDWAFLLYLHSTFIIISFFSVY